MTTPGFEAFPEIEEAFLPENALVHFHFAPHLYDYQFEGAKQLLQTADVYMPEGRGWTSVLEDEYNLASKGQLKLVTSKAAYQEQGLTTYNAEQVLSLYGSQIIVRFADIHAEEVENPNILIQADEIGTDFEALIDRTAKMVRDIAIESAMRNPVIVKNLGEVIWKLFQKNKRWAERDQIHILCTLGQNHIPIYDYLSQQPSSRDKVSGSEWVGSNLHNADIVESTEVSGGYSRATLIKSIVNDALLLPDTKHIIGQPVTLNLSPHPYRQLSPVEVFTQKLRDLIVEDIDEYPRLQKSVLSMFTGDIKPGYFALLRKYAARAGELNST